MSRFIPSKIISGGQTGVDRAGLDFAMAFGIDHGGWCPAGRLSEDGTIPSRYGLQETDSPDYPVRTEQNIVDSDATLILNEGKIKGGTALTRKTCKRLEKPYLVVDLSAFDTDELTKWLGQVKPNTLNVAGPRESGAPGIYERALDFLHAAFADQGSG